MLFFKNATRFFAVACAVIGVMLVIMSCGDTESELRSMDAERQSLTTPTSISSDQASHTEPTVTKTPTAEKQIVPVFIVNSSVVNVRQGPGTNFAVIDQVTQGEKFEANGKNQPGDWIRFCCVGGGDGWIYKELITIENEHLLSVAEVIPTLSPTPQPESSPTPQTAPSPTPKPTQSLSGGKRPPLLAYKLRQKIGVRHTIPKIIPIRNLSNFKSLLLWAVQSIARTQDNTFKIVEKLTLNISWQEARPMIAACVAETHKQERILLATCLTLHLPIRR